MRYDLKIITKNEIYTCKMQHRVNIIHGDSSLGKSFFINKLSDANSIQINNKSVTESEVLIYSETTTFIPSISLVQLITGDYKELLKDIKIMILDDRYVEEKYIYQWSTMENLIMIILSRKNDLRGIPIVKLLDYENNNYSLEDYVTITEIISHNFNLGEQYSFDILGTEDNHSNKKRYSGYKLWKSN